VEERDRHGAPRRAMRAGMAAMLAAWCALAGAPAGADGFKIGITRIANTAPIAIAIERHYFEAEGLTPEFITFDSQQPIAVAAASGDIDFGIAATTAALFNLAAQDRLRIIAGGVAEAPGFHYLAFIASAGAYAGGLKSVRDLPGHSFALTQMGTGLQYALGVIAGRNGFDVKTVRLLPLQSNSNISSAIAGGRADSAIFQSTGALPLLTAGEAKLLGWVGDETGGFQGNLTFAAIKTVADRPDTIRRFLRAFRTAARDYHDAFTAPDGTRRDGPGAPDLIAIIARYLGQSPDMVKDGLPYLDADLRFDFADVQHQIDWYRAQGLIKGEANLDALMDKRFVGALPKS
jgi:NitT/TauT family transport system substrate-binding protein